MKLYFGALGGGMYELAKKENPNAKIIDNLQDKTKELTLAGENVQDYARKLTQDEPDAVVCCVEVGLGVIPMDKTERTWREETGRALCILAEYSESVTRVVYGIGQKIK